MLLVNSKDQGPSSNVSYVIIIFTGKAKIERESRDLKLKYGVLDSARSTVGKKKKIKA